MDSFLLGPQRGHHDAVKALVVDTDPGSLQELGVALRSEGYELLEATSFEAGKQLWMAEKPPVLIADIRLGQFNGLQLLLRAKADRPDVAAVITCAFPDTVLEAETQRFGGTFLVKPLKPEALLAALAGPHQPVRFERATERRSGERRRIFLPDVLPDRRLAARRRLCRD